MMWPGANDLATGGSDDIAGATADAAMVPRLERHATDRLLQHTPLVRPLALRVFLKEEGPTTGKALVCSRATRDTRSLSNRTRHTTSGQVLLPREV